jgi:hypothetical protein
MRTVATNRKVRVLITSLRDGALIPRPEFQRRLVWSNRHKQAFLDTVLKGFPFPEIYIAAGEVDPDTAQGTEMLVDGQQRITTLFQYFSGSSELKLDDAIPAYSQLSAKDKNAFLEYDVVVRDLGTVDIGQIREVFQRINSTRYALNAMEIHNARYDGEFKTFGEELAELKFFEIHRVFTASDVRRMQDVRFCLVLVATLMSTYFDGDTELEDYLEKYNDDFPKAAGLKRSIESILEVIERLHLPEGSRVWRKPDFFTLVVELYRAIVEEKKKPALTRLSAALSAFYQKIEADGPKGRDVLAYSKASFQGTNHRGNRILRGGIVRQFIEEASVRKANALL